MDVCSLSLDNKLSTAILTKVRANPEQEDWFLKYLLSNHEYEFSKTIKYSLQVTKIAVWEVKSLIFLMN